MLFNHYEEEESESSCNVMAIERVLSYESMNVAEEELLPVIQQVNVTDTKENGINIAITDSKRLDITDSASRTSANFCLLLVFQKK